MPVRGVLTRPDAQVVFVDTPGIHKPRTLLGERLNDTATLALDGVDVTLLVVDATAPVGKGDRFVAGLVSGPSICVVNKVDAGLAVTGSAPAGDRGRGRRPRLRGVLSGVGPLRARASSRSSTLSSPACRKARCCIPTDMVTDVPEAFWVAELVREQLLAVTRDEVPHSIACRVTEWEWPRIRCEILVERESQKGIVIGRGGAVLQEVGTRARAQLPAGGLPGAVRQSGPGLAEPGPRPGAAGLLRVWATEGLGY